jgi:hypothetical protein
LLEIVTESGTEMIDDKGAEDRTNEELEEIAEDSMEDEDLLDAVEE